MKKINQNWWRLIGEVDKNDKIRNRRIRTCSKCGGKGLKFKESQGKDKDFVCGLCLLGKPELNRPVNDKINIKLK